jgi:2-hydroxycyclohexanecarboxyl-CoA dehydrogenase
MAREHSNYAIRSNVVCSGLVIPDGREAIGAVSPWAVGYDAVFNQKQIDFTLKETPLRRLITDAPCCGSPPRMRRAK